MYDGNDSAENQRQTREVAALLRAGGMDGHDANTLAILGALPGTNGQPLRQAAHSGVHWFDQLRQIALGTAGQWIAGALLTVEETFARLAALGREPSPQPVAFHCIEDGCHGRAQLMIDQLQHLGVSPSQIRRVWAFAERLFDRVNPKMRPTDEAGSALTREWSSSGITTLLRPCLPREPTTTQCCWCSIPPCSGVRPAWIPGISELARRFIYP